MPNERSHREDDRRVKRTKKILRDNLLKLLEEKPVSKISVKELTEMSEVNRSTFYFYYKDVADMVLHLQDEIYAQFEAEVLSQKVDLVEISDFSRYIETFLTFIKNNEEICRFAISNDVDNKLSARIKEALLQSIPDTKKVFPEADPRFYITIYGISGVWYTILEWMYDGMLIPPEQLATFLSKSYFYGGRSVVLGE